METKGSKSNRKKFSVLGDDTSVGSVYDITSQIKGIKKLYELAHNVDKDLKDLLIYFGSKGMDYSDIAPLCKMSVKQMNSIMSKGEQDNELGLDSIEKEYWLAYKFGLSMKEMETVDSATRKCPDKLLAVLNPTRYSDKVTDKYELPQIVFQFGADSINSEKEIEREEEIDE